jgi:bifunctional DNA-binding transcriptional regulator/antitoxin component of YhaV-PrlF toxin-antitoxin module
MVKLQQLPNGQLVLTVPKKLAEFKGWKKGTVVKFHDHSQSGFIIEAEEETE